MVRKSDAREEISTGESEFQKLHIMLLPFLEKKGLCFEISCWFFERSADRRTSSNRHTA